MEQPFAAREGNFLSSRKNSLSGCFDELTLSGSLTNSFISETAQNNNQLTNSSPITNTFSLPSGSIHIPIPRKLGQGADNTRPVFNNPFLEDFLKWPAQSQNVFPSSPPILPNASPILGSSRAQTQPSQLMFPSGNPTFLGASAYSSGHESSVDTKVTPDSEGSNQMCGPQHLFGIPFLSLFSLGAFGMAKQQPKFIGPLSLDERQEKIRKYMEKKKNRRWKSIRYSIRKSLAEKRQRYQGRFVKSDKMSFYFGNGEQPDSAGVSDENLNEMPNGAYSD